MAKVLVKICGITNLEDALCAAAAGADAVGFVFAASPREVLPAQVGKITSRLPSYLISVGLFVNALLEVILDSVEVSGVKAVQLHGEEPPKLLEELAACMSSGSRSLQAAGGKQRRLKPATTEIRDFAACAGWPALTKAFRLREEKDLERLKNYGAAQAFLIDAHVEGFAGGTGRCADWALAAAAKEFGRPVILAGGLCPENVAEAIAQVRPFAVDVSSGVEFAPGKKDPAKITEFIRRVREA